MSLEYQQVSHRYGSRRDAEPVLREVYLEARAGEITCLLGPSGSGKSTLLRLAAGLERLQTGSILLDGDLLAQPGREPPPEARPVGLVFQDHVLFPHRTVRQNVEYGLRELPARDRKSVAAAHLEAVGLADFADRYPDTLSGGQQQRVALARALAPAPRVMLLDEPFANVDATLRRSLREDARRALRDAGSIALVVTHDPDEALALADRIAVLDGGRVVQADTPEGIWRRPADRAVAELFGQAQSIKGTVERGGVATAFGTVRLDDETGLVSGQAVDVVIRPAAVRLEPAESGARVQDIRFLGDGYLVLAEADGDLLHVAAQDLGDLRMGGRVEASFHRSGTFVYTRK